VAEDETEVLKALEVVAEDEAEAEAKVKVP
jgi:hypothetical protein